jgi:hypothetical protein
MSVVPGDGNGGLLTARSFTTGTFPIAIDLGDLDGDGDLDAVTSNFGSASFSVFENTGRGDFTPRQPLPSVSSGSCAILHDRDNDGDLDITAIDEVDDLILFFENRPESTNNEANEHLTMFELGQNSPNPFSNTTRISYRLAEPGSVVLEVYDVLGRRVRTLFDGLRPMGEYEARWDGLNGRGARVASGVYIYVMQTANGRRSRRMVYY